MSDLKLDLSELRQLGAELAQVQSAFENADTDASALSSAVGDSNLSGKVHDFASGWSHKRDAMAASVKALHELLQNMTDGFTKLDGELAKAIEKADAKSGTK